VSDTSNGQGRFVPIVKPCLLINLVFSGAFGIFLATNHDTIHVLWFAIPAVALVRAAVDLRLTWRFYAAA
jgi:hypothetical protein